MGYRGAPKEGKEERQQQFCARAPQITREALTNARGVTDTTREVTTRTWEVTTRTCEVAPNTWEASMIAKEIGTRRQLIHKCYSKEKDPQWTHATS